MTQTLFQSSSLKDTFAALRADLLHEHGPRISTMRNYRFAIVQYEPAQEFALRGEVQRLAVELRKGGWFVLSISLRQLLLDRIRAEDEDFIERVTEMERRTSARDQARGRVQQHDVTYRTDLTAQHRMDNGRIALRIPAYQFTDR